MAYPLRLLTLLFVALVNFSHFSFAQVQVPELNGYVNDTVGLLRPANKASIQAKLKALAQTKGAQVVVLIIKTTEGEAIEQFAIRVAEKWKIGREKIDDGAILVIATDDRALRIEVGYGLEGALPDATCKQIIENFITPQFRAGNFDSGVELGVDAILKRIAGEELPAPSSNGLGDWIFILIIALWLVVVFFQLSRGGQGRSYRSRRGSSHWGGGGWSGGGGGFSGGGGSFGGGGASGKW